MKKTFSFSSAMRSALFLLCLFYFIDSRGQSVTPQEEALAGKIDEYVQKVLTQWELPGLAVAVSVDNKVILSKGYGIKELRPADGVGFKGARYDDRSITAGGVQGVVNEPNTPIDSKTVFQIGSVSKSFTAAIMAQLVEEKKVKWTDKVADILPDFKMFTDEDGYVTDNMMVRDCFLHSTGLSGEAGTYFGNLGYSRHDTYLLLGRMKPGFSFRSAYDYNNITFMIACEIIEKLTGKTWEELIEERLFKPLGMNASRVNAEGFANSKNVATPHDWRYNGKIDVQPLYANEQALHWLTVIGPAGGVSSNVEDMIRYAQFHCNNGYIVNRDASGAVTDTTFIMPRRAMQGLHRGYTITSQDSTKTNLYAMCWFVEQNNRFRLYFHTGTTWGMTAICFFVPEHKISGVVLVNSEVNANPRYAIMRRVIDLVRTYQGVDSEPAALRDYSTEYFNDYKASRDKTLETQAAAPKPAFVEEVQDPTVFAGRYVKDELFGDLIVTYENPAVKIGAKGKNKKKATLEKEKLYIEFGKKKGEPGFKNELKHINGTTYEFRRDGYGFKVTFQMTDYDAIPNIEDRAKISPVKGLTMEFGCGEESYFGGWTKE